MEVRKTVPGDLERMEEIYAAARAFMKETGNPNQWGDHHPARAILEDDIAKGQSYVCVEGGKVVGTFCFYVGEEPTYAVIREGTWQNDKPYGVIHRVASDGTVHGVTKACIDFCFAQWPNLRIDTHRLNTPMRGAVLKNGFTYCGLITVEDGSERLAYQRCEE